MSKHGRAEGARVCVRACRRDLRGLNVSLSISCPCPPLQCKCECVIERVSERVRECVCVYLLCVRPRLSLRFNFRRNLPVACWVG